MENKEIVNYNEVNTDDDNGSKMPGTTADNIEQPISESVEHDNLADQNGDTSLMENDPHISESQDEVEKSSAISTDIETGKSESDLKIQPSETSVAPEQTSDTDIDIDPEIKADLLAHDEDDQLDEEQDKNLSEKYNSFSREQLVESLEALVKGEEYAQIRKRIGYIKLAFRNHLKAESVSIFGQRDESTDVTVLEMPVVNVDPLVERFETAFNIYKAKKLVYEQSLEKQKQENLVTKENILSELRNLIESDEELKRTYDAFKELQEKWRKIGPVTQSAKNTLWNNYHFLVEKFFDKVKINKELRDLDLRKNLESKTELCEKAEELLLNPLNKSFEYLQKLHEAWKEIGPVPKDKKDEIWERFKGATDKLNLRRQEYFESLREEQSKNYIAKLALCEKVEQMAELVFASPREWQKATDDFNELFNMWKSVGFAPKKVNNEVWNRFRTALDVFFKNKKAFFLKYKDEQTENYNQKLNLCLQAEALMDSEDWKQTTEELIALQQQWKKIGAVPNKFSDKIWKRFRDACDTFFNRKSQYFSNVGDKQEENLAKKRELINRIRNYPYTQNSSDNLNILKEFQREWMDIGHVPIKLKDKIQEEYRKTIDDQFEKLSISKKVKNTLGFKKKIENLKNNPNSENIIYKERSFIISKISTLQNDIKLWENNIGFFASSKKADILKSEFEQRIEKARNDIAILEEKLKIIRES